MATPRKKTPRKRPKRDLGPSIKIPRKAATRRAGRKIPQRAASPAARKAPRRATGRIELPERAARRATGRRVAAKIPAHPASPRGGRPCKACTRIHSRRQHGSHAEGKSIPFSYKTRREGIFARPRPTAKKARKGARKVSARRRAGR